MLFLQKILWWASGADPDILSHPKFKLERMKYSTIGMAAVITATLATISGTYGLYTIFAPSKLQEEFEINLIKQEFNNLKEQQNQEELTTKRAESNQKIADLIRNNKEERKQALIAAMAFGFIWGMFTLNLDRLIFISISERTNTKKTNNFAKKFIDRTVGASTKLISLSIRIAVAIMVGLIISKPLEVKIFEAEIDKQLKKITEQEYSNFEQENIKNRGEQKNINRLNAKNNTLQLKLEKLEGELSKSENELVGEIGGKIGSGEPGNGPTAQSIRERVNRIKNDIRDKEQEIQNNEIEINNLKEGLDERKQSFESEQLVTNSSLPTRLTALSQYIKEDETGTSGWINIAIMGLFVAIEVAPILAKLSLKSGAYEIYKNKTSQDIQEKLKASGGSSFFRQNRKLFSPSLPNITLRLAVLGQPQSGKDTFITMLYQTFEQADPRDWFIRPKNDTARKFYDKNSRKIDGEGKFPDSTPSSQDELEVISYVLQRATHKFPYNQVTIELLNVSETNYETIPVRNYKTSSRYAEQSYTNIIDYLAHCDGFFILLDPDKPYTTQDYSNWLRNIFNQLHKKLEQENNNDNLISQQTKIEQYMAFCVTKIDRHENTYKSHRKSSKNWVENIIGKNSLNILPNYCMFDIDHEDNSKKNRCRFFAVSSIGKYHNTNKTIKPRYVPIDDNGIEEPKKNEYRKSEGLITPIEWLIDNVSKNRPSQLESSQEMT